MNNNDLIEIKEICKKQSIQITELLERIKHLENFCKKNNLNMCFICNDEKRKCEKCEKKICEDCEYDKCHGGDYYGRYFLCNKCFEEWSSNW